MDGVTVSVLGSQPELPVLRQVGYLPEEAGLPAKARVIDTICYLARLKGLSRAAAEARGNELLRRVNPLPTSSSRRCPVPGRTREAWIIFAEEPRRRATR